MAPRVIHLDRIDSTNHYVRQALADGRLSGRGLVVARVQTRGRGTGRRRWHSCNDLGFWATWFDRLDRERPFVTVMRVSLAVAGALEAAGAAATLKWPNDVEVNRRKICGILAETAGQHLVVGFGVNLRQCRADFPVRLRTKATSLFMETGTTLTNRRFLGRFLAGLKPRQQEKTVFRRYRERLGIAGSTLHLDGRPVRVVDVLPEGCLRVRQANGRIKKIFSGRLEWRQR